MTSIPPRPTHDQMDWQPTVARPIPWEQFRAEVLSLYGPPMRAKGTFNRIRYILEQLSALGIASTAELTVPFVARFIAGRPATESATTTWSLTRDVKNVCNYAAAAGYLARSPFAIRKQWVRRGPPKPKQHHTREEIARVLARMKEDIGRKEGHMQAGPWTVWRARRLYALASTVAYTGLRKNEALFLRVEDIDLAARMLFIVSRRGNRLKTERSAQPIPMPDALVPILAEWLPHLEVMPEGDAKGSGPLPASNPEGIRDPGWVFPNSYRTGPWSGGSPGHRPLDRMKALGKRAGVEGFTFLSLRHSYATHAEFWGLSDSMIQRVLRHTSTATQWHYRHADIENMRAKVNAIGFGHAVAETEADAALSGPPVPSSALSPAIAAEPRVCSWPKLDDDDAEDMRRLRAAGWTYLRLARHFGVSKSTVHYTLYGVIHRPPAGDGEQPRC